MPAKYSRIASVLTPSSRPSIARLYPAASLSLSQAMNAAGVSDAEDDDGVAVQAVSEAQVPLGVIEQLWTRRKKSAR